MKRFPALILFFQALLPANSQTDTQNNPQTAARDSLEAMVLIGTAKSDGAIDRGAIISGRAGANLGTKVGFFVEGASFQGSFKELPSGGSSVTTSFHSSSIYGGGGLRFAPIAINRQKIPGDFAPYVIGGLGIMSTRQVGMREGAVFGQIVRTPIDNSFVQGAGSAGAGVRWFNKDKKRWGLAFEYRAYHGFGVGVGWIRVLGGGLIFRTL